MKATPCPTHEANTLDRARRSQGPALAAFPSLVPVGGRTRPLLAGLACLLGLLPSLASAAATRYVWRDSPNPTAPYTNWTTAARNIQAAVDAAQAGDTVLVTNGVYATKGRAVYGTMTNRVAVTKPVRVESVNGPAVTVIQGYQVPGTTNGDAAIRCVHLTNGAVLSGFTLTNGATRNSGDYEREQSGGGVWCESTNALATNCALTGNSAYAAGGGAYSGMMNHCTLTGNSAPFGGGASDGALNNCTITGNWATGRFARGGGTCYAALNNCVLTGNSAQSNGGGAYQGTLHNCTVTANSASWGGGASDATVNNCILYYNTAGSGGANYSDGTLNYSCTTPLPATGNGNISAEPQLASSSHLGVGSPCRGAGSALYATGLDIDGEPWANPPSMGCDEYSPGTTTGPLSVGLQAAYTNVAVGFAVAFTGQIEGRGSANRWEFGDGTVASNRPSAQHVWMSAGDYTVRFTAFNDDHTAGVSAVLVVRVVAQPVHYVAAGSAAPVAPYTNWATAARTIQKAVNAATVPGALVLVSNGVYAAGGKAIHGTMTNRVAVDKPLRVESVNGPAVTVIEGWKVPGTGIGDGAVRCVYLTNGAVLAGFTLSNGATRGITGSWREQSAGGVWCEPVSALVTNCTIVDNSARSGGGTFCGTLNNCTLTGNSARVDRRDGETWGGGAFYGTLNNCTLTGNSSSSQGGGASYSTLNNCTLTGNSAEDGGGASMCIMNDCLLAYNHASSVGAWWSASGAGSAGGILNNCTLTGNSVHTSGDNAHARGGGSAGGILNNCTLSGNSVRADGSDSWSQGGGSWLGTLNNCTLTANSAYDCAGGVSLGTLNNCILYYNTASRGGPNDCGSTLNYCCTTPLPSSGTGNITNPPVFVDYAGGNLRLQSNSPCINAGTNTYMSGTTDMDGRPRIVGGTVDIGAYEFQTPASVLSYAWLQQYGLPTDGSADFADPDHDGLNNWQEWLCGTKPTNALSVLRLLPLAATESAVTVKWRSVTNRTYFLERSTNLAASPAFFPLANGLPGQRGTTTFTDTNAPSLGPRFYRVGTQP